MMNTFFRTANRLTVGAPEPMRGEFIALRVKLRPALDALSVESWGQRWQEQGRMRMRDFRAKIAAAKAPVPAARHGWWSRVVRHGR